MNKYAISTPEGSRDRLFAATRMFRQNERRIRNLYVALVLLFLSLQRKHLEDYYRCSVILMLGMSTCLLIYYLFPNAQNMRPTEFTNSNIFTDIIGFIYSSDTDTNVLPSIHVYNSVAIHVAFAKSHYFKERKGWQLASLILCTLICLSTMFLKQHSFLDVITAIILYMIYYILIYQVLPKREDKKNSYKQIREENHYF